MAYNQLLIEIKRQIGPHSSTLLWGKPQSVVMNKSRSLHRRSKHGTYIKSDHRKVMDPMYSKGLGYTHEERQKLNVIGLFPCSFRNEAEQLHAVRVNFEAEKTNIGRYLYLRSLRARQERLYYRFISDQVKEVMPVIYTPTVGAICQRFSMMYHAVTGLYVTKFDKGNIMHVLNNWPVKDIRAVCVTDGERILGLGDLGANGMGISVGKLDLYTALGNIPPHYLVPIVLDVGTNNEQLLCDPMYIGVREKRCRGKEYEDIVQEFMDGVVSCWGYQTLIHFEDFATPNAFMLIKKYQHKYCYINDDIQGTASTGLAGFLAVEHITKKPLNEHVILFVGAGSAALGISKLVLKEMSSRKISDEDALKNIYLVDADGLVTKGRDKYLIPDVITFAKDMPPNKDLQAMVDEFKPSIILGASGQGGLFTEDILRSMAKNHERPAIFACSNPTNKSECTAEQAFNFTEGRALFAAGSPFPPVVMDGKRLLASQANNAFAFPGVALGVLCTRPRKITDDVFLIVAHAIAKYAMDSDPETALLYPPVSDAAHVAFSVAVAVAQYLVDKDLASIYPVPKNICEHVKNYQYFTEHDTALPPTWEYPEMPSLPLPKDDKKKTEK